MKLTGIARRSLRYAVGGVVAIVLTTWPASGQDGGEEKAAIAVAGSALAAIVSPLIGGYIIDRSGKWEMTFVAGIALLLLGAVLAFWMKPDEELEDPADGERAAAHAPFAPAPAAR